MEEGSAIQRKRTADDPGVVLALSATAWVFVLPAIAVISWIAMSEPDPPVMMSSAVSLLLPTITSTIGASWWARSERYRGHNFGDLMVWSWVSRRVAERKLREGTRSLGLDRSGERIAETVMSRAEQLRVLRSLNEALETKDPYTRGHSQRVERHAYRTAMAMGLGPEEVEDIRVAAGLHDIGKIRVSNEIIAKPGALTDDERRAMQEHSAAGAGILEAVASERVVDAVRFHHERWDGQGYPKGIAGQSIPLEARIIAVADTFDAITSTRPYRAKEDRTRAVEVLKQEAGYQFDPEVVEAFLAELPARGYVAAMALALPGVHVIARQIALVLRRAGAAGLAAGVSVSASTAMLGSAALPPDPTNFEPPAVVTVGQGHDGRLEAADDAESESVLGIRFGSGEMESGTTSGTRGKKGARKPSGLASGAGSRLPAQLGGVSEDVRQDANSGSVPATGEAGLDRTDEARATGEATRKQKSQAKGGPLPEDAQ